MVRAKKKNYLQSWGNKRNDQNLKDILRGSRLIIRGLELEALSNDESHLGFKL